MGVKGVAFDLEGTSVDVEFAHHQGHLLAARDLGVEFSIDWAIQDIPHFIGGPDIAIAQKIYQLSNKEKTEEEFVDSFLSLGTTYFEEIRDKSEIVIRDGLTEFLAWLDALGLKRAIGSATRGNDATLLLERSGFGRHFDPDKIVLGHEIEHPKPAPDVFWETAKRMAIAAESQLVFEDSPRGVCAGVAASARVIGMPVYHLARVEDALVTAGAMRVFRSWNEPALRECVMSLL